MSTVTLDEVSVAYRNGPVVDRVSASVTSGEWLGVIGPNGAGKSSLLKAIAGINPSSGRIDIDGVSLAGQHARRRAALVAYVPQDPVLPDDMSGFEYALLGRSPHVGYFAGETAHDRATVTGVLDRLDLASLAERPLSALSGGERQRIVIARALATEAPILLLDEPTSALDIGHQQRVLDLVAELRDHHRWTVIAAMHDLTLAGQYADRLMLMNEGSVTSLGAPDVVLTAGLLEATYGVNVEVLTTDGTITVVPRRTTC